MERLTFEIHDGGMFVKQSDVKTFEVEDEIMHTGNAIRKLAKYEDLEEQGLLLRLPCKVGDTVYVIGSLSEFGVTEEIELQVFECIVSKITLNGKYGNTMQMDCKEHSLFGWSMNMRKIDELVFLTKEEAEQALKQMGE